MSLEQQLTESRDSCHQLSRQRDDLVRELGQVNEEFASEKQQRLSVSSAFAAIVMLLCFVAFLPGQPG